jgi:aminobenzoyl-glutamate transport protein
MLMGVAVAESSGLIGAMMRAVAFGVPDRLLVPVLFVVSACSTVGSDAGVVIMPPLAAAVFRSRGRHPIVGLLIGYAGATTGYTANLFPTGTDVIAMALTNEASGGDPEIGVLANYWFKVASVLLLAILATVVTARFIAPRFPEEAGSSPTQELVPEEKRGLRRAAIVLSIVLLFWAVTMWGEAGVLRGAGMVPILFSLFVAGGLAFRKIDVLAAMSEGMKRMGPYLVLIFAISQFIEIFRFAQLDRLAATEGAALLRALGFERLPIPFFLGFICCIAIANLFIGSASAKWAIFAPIFVPMFMALGYHPAFTQLLYRIGDSGTDGITPLSPFFPLLVGWIAEIDPKQAKIGTVLSYLLPYTVVLLPGWILMVVVWYLIGLPVGPDSPIHLAR